MKFVSNRVGFRIPQIILLYHPMLPILLLPLTSLQKFSPSPADLSFRSAHMLPRQRTPDCTI